MYTSLIWLILMTKVSAIQHDRIAVCWLPMLIWRNTLSRFCHWKNPKKSCLSFNLMSRFSSVFTGIWPFSPNLWSCSLRAEMCQCNNYTSWGTKLIVFCFHDNILFCVFGVLLHMEATVKEVTGLVSLSVCFHHSFCFHYGSLFCMFLNSDFVFGNNSI